MRMTMVATDPPVWVIESSYDERKIPSEAKAWWHPGKPCDRAVCAACKAGIGKSWWTRDMVVAARLAGYADKSTREILEAMLRKSSDSIEASRASDANISVPVPNGLSLLPFQRAGVAYAKDRTGTLIGDEMGLGKTIQAIALTNIWSDVHRVLVICPAFLRINWQREFARWSTRGLKTGIVDRSVWPSVPECDLKVVIVNYDVLSRHVDALKVGWDLVILDEAHYIKNPDAQRTKLALGVTARRRLYLTGTPMLNRPRELWTLVNSLAPKVFPSKYGFLHRYCGPEQVFVPGKGMVTKFDGGSNLDELYRKLREWLLLRRTKDDVLKDLPPKRRTVICVEANGSDALIRKEFAALEKACEKAGAAVAGLAYEDAVAALQQAEEIAFQEMSEVRHEVALAKVPKVIEYVLGMLEGGIEKVVVFCHHKDVAAQLFVGLADYSPVVCTGDMTKENRQWSVDTFQANKKARVFIGTIMAAGVGLTLTAASNVVFAELDWVPGNISQAEDRCHRIGQHDSVNVYHLVFDGSLDSKMAKMIIEKQGVADRTLDNGSTPAITLSPIVESRDREVLSLPKQEPALPAEVVASVHEGLRLLAGMCDGARTRDRMGFNGTDTVFGKELARLPSLTPKQALAAKRMLKKYHGQLGPALVMAIWPDWEER